MGKFNLHRSIHLNQLNVVPVLKYIYNFNVQEFLGVKYSNFSKYSHSLIYLTNH